MTIRVLFNEKFSYINPFFCSNGYDLRFVHISDTAIIEKNTK